MKQANKGCTLSSAKKEYITCEAILSTIIPSLASSLSFSQSRALRSHELLRFRPLCLNNRRGRDPWPSASRVRGGLVCKWSNRAKVYKDMQAFPSEGCHSSIERIYSYTKTAMHIQMRVIPFLVDSSNRKIGTGAEWGLFDVSLVFVLLKRECFCVTKVEVHHATHF